LEVLGTVKAAVMARGLRRMGLSGLVAWAVLA
jgi:hypothetical protein